MIIMLLNKQIQPYRQFQGQLSLLQRDSGISVLYLKNVGMSPSEYAYNVRI